MLKHVHKEEQLLIIPSSRSKLHRQLMRELSMQAKLPHHQRLRLNWLIRESKLQGKHIPHAVRGHGGERWLESAPVDGCDPTTKCSNTVSATGKDVVNVLQKSSHNQTQEDVHLATVEHT